MQHWLFVLVFCVIAHLAFAENQTTVLDFCNKYSSCRAKARAQLQNCTGGFAQMILSKHAANAVITINGTESLKICTAELAANIEKSIHRDYEHIEEQTFKCTKEANPSSFPLEKTQELICQAVYKETNLDSIEIQGIESSVECYQVYEADLRRCELVRECCPQFESCLGRVEKESGISAKERAIASQLQRCFKKSGIEIGLNNDDDEEAKKEDLIKDEVDVRFAPTKRPNHHRFDPKLPRATPVPRTKNGTLTNHGVFLIKEQDALKKKKHRKPTKQDKSEESGEKDDLADLNSELIAQEIAKKLQEFQALQPKIEASKEKPSQKILHDEPKVQIPSPKSSNKQILNELLCRQYAECEEIVEKEEHECDSLFGGGHSDDNGIEDTEIRAIFLNNSKSEDPQIRRKCLENVDAQTQKHLIYLKNEINRQNEECAFENYSENVELNGCQKLGLLSELAALKRPNKDPLINSVEKCKERLSGFRQKCRSLQACCPQRVSCELTNQSSQVRQYGDINAQLKMEQTLCELRLQRIHDGITIN